jgi:hypothetical protein
MKRLDLGDGVVVTLDGHHVTLASVQWEMIRTLREQADALEAVLPVFEDLPLRVRQYHGPARVKGIFAWAFHTANRILDLRQAADSLAQSTVTLTPDQWIALREFLAREEWPVEA